MLSPEQQAEQAVYSRAEQARLDAEQQARPPESRAVVTRAQPASAADPLDGLRALPAGSSLDLVETALREMVSSFNGADPLRRQTVREAAMVEVKRLGVMRPARMVDAALGVGEHHAESTKGQGHALRLEDPEPWPEPVDGAELLEDLAGLFNRYLVLPEGAADVLALWTAHTYAVDHFDHTGYLALVSPTPRCGKTTGLTLVKALAHRALSGDNVSAAAIFRVIEEVSPTLLIDELDRVPAESDVWGILNSGHGRGGSVLRVVGETLEPRAFATYCPKVVCYIRPARSPVPVTVEDRSIRVCLQRKRRSEPREKVRSRVLEAEALPFRRRLMRWSEDHADALDGSRPSVPEELDDRAFDCWEPLLAVAEEAGGRWAETGRALAVRFSADRAEEEAEAPGVRLLLDLGNLLEAGALQPDQWGLSGETMARLLRELPDRPWRSWGRQGQGLTDTALGRLLKPFGVRSAFEGPKTVRVRRYAETTIRAACERFSPGERVGETRSPSHQAESGPVSDSAISGERVSGSDPLAGGKGEKQTLSPPDESSAGQLGLRFEDGSAETEVLS